MRKGVAVVSDWSGRQDSNLRPHGPKPCALPGCATPRDFLIDKDLVNQRPNFISEILLGQVGFFELFFKKALILRAASAL